jgi:hypothetical protein
MTIIRSLPFAGTWQIKKPESWSAFANGTKPVNEEIEIAKISNKINDFLLATTESPK